MNIHSHILCTAMLTAVLITHESKFALLFPVWAIVAISSALPAMVVLAAMMCIEALEAAILGWHTRRLYLAIEGLAAMQADKLLGMVFRGSAKASMATVVPDGCRGASGKSELPATLLADKLDEWVLSHGYAMSFAKAFTRAISAFLSGPIEENFATNRAGGFDAGNTGGHPHTSGSINRDSCWGAFPGKNACRWAASPPKPHVKYTAIRRMCQGGAYAKC